MFAISKSFGTAEIFMPDSETQNQSELAIKSAVENLQKLQAERGGINAEILKSKESILMGHVKVLGPAVLSYAIGIPAAMYAYNVSPYPFPSVVAWGVLAAIVYPGAKYSEEFRPYVVYNKQLVERKIDQLKSGIESIEAKESVLKSIFYKFTTFKSATEDRLPDDVIGFIGRKYFSITQ